MSMLKSGAGCVLFAFASLAQAAGPAGDYPVRPIRMVVPNTAGSATDTVARLVAQRLADAFGQQTVVDNRSGASGIVGHEIVAKAVPDGYTLMVSTSAGLLLNPLLTKVPYDSYRDFVPISLLVVSPQLLFSHPGVPARTVGELIDLARAKPGQLNCASPGFGTSNHLGCEMLKTMGQVNFLHVPYKGTSPAVSDVVGGQVQFMFNSMPNVMPLVKAGKLRAIALAATKRASAAPDIPTVAETLPGFQCVTWYAMIAPRGVPAPIVAKVNAEIARMFTDPKFAQRIVDMGQDPQPTSPEGLTKHMRDEAARWMQVIKAAGLKIER